jgi:hypothetical protein
VSRCDAEHSVNRGGPTQWVRWEGSVRGLCGSEAYFCLVEPITEYGMADYRLDEVEKPERHSDAVKRLTEPQRRSISSQGAELPGGKFDGRRSDIESGKVRATPDLFGAD